MVDKDSINDSNGINFVVRHPIHTLLTQSQNGRANNTQVCIPGGGGVLLEGAGNETSAEVTVNSRRFKAHNAR